MNTNLKELFENPILQFTNDFVFKKVITCPEDNYIILRSLIHAVIGGPEITSLQILNSEDTIENEKMKQIRYDIKAQLETGETIDIEMQKASISREEMKDRAAYYEARLFSNQASSGIRYHNIKTAYLIVFCDFPIFKNKRKWRGNYTFIDDDIEKEEFSNILTDKMKVIIIEIDKAELFEHYPIEKLTPLQRWIILLGMRNVDKAQAIIKKDAVLEKAVEQLRKITQNDIDQAWAESHFKYVTDEIAFRLDAQAQGKEEGLKEGEELANYQMAKKMLNENLDIDLITRITGLSKEDLLQLTNEDLK